MKELQLIAGKDPQRPAMLFIQAKNNSVNATDSIKAIMLPVVEVFGEDVIEENEELYFLASDWSAAKMHKAAKITRDKNTFFATDSKNKSLGFMVAKTKEEIDGIFPDISTVIPKDEDATPITQTAFVAQYLADIYKAWGHVNFYITFHKNGEILKIKHKDSGGIALLSGLLLEACLPESVETEEIIPATEKTEDVNEYL